MIIKRRQDIHLQYGKHPKEKAHNAVYVAMVSFITNIPKEEGTDAEGVLGSY